MQYCYGQGLSPMLGNIIFILGTFFGLADFLLYFDLLITVMITIVTVLTGTTLLLL